MFCCHCNVIIFAKNVYDYNIYTLIGNVYNIYEKLFKQLMIVILSICMCKYFSFFKLASFPEDDIFHVSRFYQYHIYNMIGNIVAAICSNKTTIRNKRQGSYTLCYSIYIVKQ